MSKPVNSYPAPEPIDITPKLVYLGSGLCGILLFIIGWTFRTVVIA